MEEPHPLARCAWESDHVGSGAADYEHDGSVEGLGRRRVKALRFSTGPSLRAGLDPAQRTP